MTETYSIKSARHYSRRRRKKIIILCLVLVLVGIGAIAYSQMRRLNSQTHTTIEDRSPAQMGYISPYFVFHDTNKWSVNRTDSSKTKFVYDNYENGVLKRQLKTYVNYLPSTEELSAQRVLPVKITKHELEAQSVSENCSTVYKPLGDNQAKDVVVAGSTMFCNPADKTYSVQLAEQGGSYKINMRRANGDKLFYIIIYKDYTSAPDPSILLNITNTFFSL